MGADHYPVRPRKGGQPQEGQVGPVGSVHKQSAPVGVYHPGNGLNIRQHSGICRGCNTDSFDIWVVSQGNLHLLRGDGADEVLLLQPGPLQVYRLQVQQGHGVEHRPVAVPVHQHPVPRSTQEGQAGVDAHGGPAGEELTVVKAEALRPRFLSGVEGLPGQVQVAGAGDLGHIQPGRVGQLRQGEGAALVARHVEASGVPGGVVSKNITERGHGKTSKAIVFSTSGGETVETVWRRSSIQKRKTRGRRGSRTARVV